MNLAKSAEFFNPINVKDRVHIIGCGSVGSAVAEQLPEATFHTKIRNSVAIAEAPAFHKSIFDYRPSSHGAIDFGALVAEIIDMEVDEHE